MFILTMSICRESEAMSAGCDSLRKKTKTLGMGSTFNTHFHGVAAELSRYKHTKNTWFKTRTPQKAPNSNARELQGVFGHPTEFPRRWEQRKPLVVPWYNP
jgi:hypothetical protein